MLGLCESSVTGGIPDREADPFLASSIEGNTKATIAERQLVGGRDDIAAGCLAVAPNGFNEFQREGPFDVGNDFAIGALTFDGTGFNEYLARRDKKIASP